LKDVNVSGQAPIAIQFGNPGNVPVVGDWTGAGLTTIGVYDPNTQTFTLRYSNLGSLSTESSDPVVAAPFIFGNAGDLPLAGDWNGDGITTIGVYRPSVGAFYLRNSNTSGAADVVANNFGATVTDLPVVGSWGANGTTGVGYYRPSTNTFYLWKNSISGSPPDYVFTYGSAGDLPVAGHWTGTG